MSQVHFSSIQQVAIFGATAVAIVMAPVLIAKKAHDIVQVYFYESNINSITNEEISNNFDGWLAKLTEFQKSSEIAGKVAATFTWVASFMLGIVAVNVLAGRMSVIK